MENQDFDMNKELRDLWQRFHDNGVVLQHVHFDVIDMSTVYSNKFSLVTVGADCKLKDSSMD